MIPLNTECWLCGGSKFYTQPSEIPNLPSLIRCSDCNCNQGRTPEIKQLTLFGGVQ